jgi:hypothetical protein
MRQFQAKADVPNATAESLTARSDTLRVVSAPDHNLLPDADNSCWGDPQEARVVAVASDRQREGQKGWSALIWAPGVLPLLDGARSARPHSQS